MADLKLCPFCGGTAEQDYARSFRWLQGGRLDHGAAIYCTFCNADMIMCRGDHPELSDDERMAVMVENWNRRPAQPAQVACPCITIEQSSSCSIGHPSMLCGICKGTGNTTPDQVTALACEMIKIANELGEPEDPFAAWETLDLIKTEHENFGQILREKFADTTPTKGGGD